MYFLATSLIQIAIYFSPTLLRVPGLSSFTIAASSSQAHHGPIGSVGEIRAHCTSTADILCTRAQVIFLGLFWLRAFVGKKAILVDKKWEPLFTSLDNGTLSVWVFRARQVLAEIWLACCSSVAFTASGYCSGNTGIESNDFSIFAVFVTVQREGNFKAVFMHWNCITCLLCEECGEGYICEAVWHWSRLFSSRLRRA